ncbi:Retrovirus-related Pol polyprotein from transposon TNT 1-94 [Porphyridium purpureum]|uniref:Retrovirus-related Pol polyprotein from transposon TNT 1-94 n=1 Tax=Porphyridium purpureum TaxID=35688 RepID=A0A5J4Z331_PORPP|nr:Retrovirus-related Pol polyprotein from transposon TNT 1-94 [Porphyridium purpureum]|eukprot:POR2744..scf295_1
MCKPMQYILLDRVTSKSAHHLQEALHKQFASLKSFGAKVVEIRSDPESGIVAAVDWMKSNGVIPDILAAGEAVQPAERAIRMVKERMRCVLSGLPFRMPKSLTGFLAEYVVQRINMMKSSVAPEYDGRSPYEDLTGRLVDAKKELALGFGDYCQSHSKSVDSTMAERTTGCIALRPTLNLAGSWLFYNLNTKNIITRQKWNQLPHPDFVISRMNEIAEQQSASGVVIDIEDQPHDDEEEDVEGLLIDEQDRPELNAAAQEDVDLVVVEADEDGDASVETAEENARQAQGDPVLEELCTAEVASNAAQEALGTETRIPTEQSPAESYSSPQQDVRALRSQLTVRMQAPLGTAKTRSPTSTQGPGQQHFIPSASQIVPRATAPEASPAIRQEYQGSTLAPSALNDQRLSDMSTSGGRNGCEPEVIVDPLTRTSTATYIDEHMVKLAGKRARANGSVRAEDIAEKVAKLQRRIDEIDQREKEIVEIQKRTEKNDRSKTGKRKQSSEDWADDEESHKADAKKGRAFVLSANKKGLTANMSLMSAFRKHGLKAVRAVVKEVAQLDSKYGFGVITPVSVQSLSEAERKQILPTHIFLREKLDADGSIQKIKARVVAGGNHQDPAVYPKKSSPTVATDSLLLLAAIAANAKYAVGKADFPGAFLNALMPPDGPKVHVRLDRYLTRVLCGLDDKYLRYVRSDGGLVCVLKKALYGTIMAARQWFLTVKKMLQELRFSQNRFDECVFRRGNVSLAIHVDDIIVFAPSAREVKIVLDEIERRYPGLQREQGDTVEYLGMRFAFDRSTATVLVSMNGYIGTMLSEFGASGRARTPAGTDLYEVGSTERLTRDKKDDFHTWTAKLLYVAKRVRPDILTAVGYLTTRVHEPNIRDWQKLERVMKYLAATQEMGLRLGASTEKTVVCGADASYGACDDYRSVTGTSVTLGTGAVYARSSKQKLVTKSSTEAELVAASDSLGQVLWTARFLRDQGFELKESVLLQDNNSAIALMKHGKPTSMRTKHIGIRYFVVHDAADRGDIRVVYCPTEDLTADLLTKPLQGKVFEKHRANLLGSASTKHVAYDNTRQGGSVLRCVEHGG